MKLTLTIPDSLYEAYEKMAERLNGKAAPPDMILAQLERFKHVHAADRIIVVDSASRERLELLLGGSQIPSGQALAERVALLAEIKIGSVKVQFTPEQMGELKRRASRNGTTVEEYTRSVVQEMEWQFFDHISAG